MNKYMTLIVLIFFLVLITLVADSALGISTSVSVVDDLNYTPPNDWLSRLSGVLKILESFYKIVTFRVGGIPPFLNLLVFYPVSFGILYMIINIIRGN